MLPNDPWDPRFRGRSSTASSTDSLDSILAQFEVVQAQPGPSPRQPQSPGANLLNAILQHSPLAGRLQGRPPRPELNVTSAPYRPKHRRRRTSSQDDQGYQSQLLLPVSNSPQPSSSPRSRSVQDVRPSLEAARLAVNLTEDSPAVAASPSPADVRRQWRGAAGREEGMCASPSLESFGSLSSSRSVSPDESATPRWGQPPRDNLFPLNLPLPPFPRPASPVTPREMRWAPEGMVLEQGAPAMVVSPFANASSQMLPASGHASPRSFGQGSAESSVPPSPHASDVVEQQANRGDSSSGGLTPKSEESTPTSASDYGSVAGADVGANPALKSPLSPETTWHIAPPLFSGTVGKPQLRKRDFESELLERLLSSSARGQYMSPVRETAATRGVWRAFGLPRVAFVSTVFLCLLLFLAIFSAGRVHAQRSVRMEAAQPSIELLALNQLAALEAEIDAEIAAFPAPIATGDVKHRHGGGLPLDLKHLHLHLDGQIEEPRVEDGKRRNRHGGPIQETDGGPGRHKPGLRLLLAAGTGATVRSGFGGVFR